MLKFSNKRANYRCLNNKSHHWWLSLLFYPLKLSLSQAHRMMSKSLRLNKKQQRRHTKKSLLNFTLKSLSFNHSPRIPTQTLSRHISGSRPCKIRLPQSRQSPWKSWPSSSSKWRTSRTRTPNLCSSRWCIISHSLSTFLSLSRQHRNFLRISIKTPHPLLTWTTSMRK